MFFYSFFANDMLHQVIVDENGTPLQKNEIEIDKCENEDFKEKLLKNPNLIICGETISYDEYNNPNIIYRQPITYYLDEPVSNILNDSSTEEDWENFFETNQIGYEINRQSKTYSLH